LKHYSVDGIVGCTVICIGSAGLGCIIVCMSNAVLGAWTSLSRCYGYCPAMNICIRVLWVNVAYFCNIAACSSNNDLIECSANYCTNHCQPRKILLNWRSFSHALNPLIYYQRRQQKLSTQQKEKPLLKILIFTKVYYYSMRIHWSVLAMNYPSYLLAFIIGFASSLISGKIIEIFNNRLLLSLLNFVIASISIIMFRKFGKDIKADLIIAASLLFGILLGYLILSALSGM